VLGIITIEINQLHRHLTTWAWERELQVVELSIPLEELLSHQSALLHQWVAEELRIVWWVLKVGRLHSLIETSTKETTITTILWRLNYLMEDSFNHLQFSTFRQVQISTINSLGQARVFQLSICSQILMLSPMQLQLVLHLSQEQPLPGRDSNTKTISKIHQ
jgi:hypothetical protein